MTLEDAYRKLPEYEDGGLSPVERQEIERLIEEDAAFKQAWQTGNQISSLLSEQTWIEPSAAFTRTVLLRALTEAPRPLPGWVRMWEPTKIGVSFFTVGLMLALSGQTLLKMGFKALQQLGVWLDLLTGTRVFELNPLIVLAIVLPVAVGGWATCVIMGRCRVMS
ncbi:MAG: hypothetical protein ACOZB3_08805 [Calditrichota bacterium]